jgi:hypothetical protein
MLIYLFIALLLVILFVDTVDPGPSKTISLFWAFSEIKKNKIRIMSEIVYNGIRPIWVIQAV